MTSANAYRPDDWDDVVAKRLPVLRLGQNNARVSWERIVSTVTAEIRTVQSGADEHELRLVAAVAALDYELKTILLRLVEASEDRAWVGARPLHGSRRLIDEVCGGRTPRSAARSTDDSWF